MTGLPWILISRDKDTKLQSPAADGENLSENGEVGESHTFVVVGRWFHFGG